MIRSILIFVIALSFVTVAFTGVGIAQPPVNTGPPQIQQTGYCVYQCVGQLQGCIESGVEDPNICACFHNTCIDICFERQGQKCDVGEI